MAVSGAPFGKYLLHERVGAGGMAEVWRATLPGAGGIDKPCVIKRILPRYALDSKFVEAFLAEARVSISLQHGNIVQVLDFGEVDGSYYLALEHVAGRDLRAILRRLSDRSKQCPVPIATLISIEISRGLAYAHGKVSPEGKHLGLVHRDVSPSNVLVSFEGDVKLADFGIAKIRARTTVTEKNELVGKIPYMSPEQARGEAVDARADVWAAGVVLYEMLTSRRPYGGRAEGFDLLATIQTAPGFDPPRRLRPEVPEELDEIVSSCLQAPADSRLQDARRLQVALSGFSSKYAPNVTSTNLRSFLRGLFPEEAQRYNLPVGDPDAPTDPSVELPRFSRAVRPVSDREFTAWPPPMPRPSPSASQETLVLPVAASTEVEATGFVATETHASRPPSRRRIATAVVLGALGGIALTAWAVSANRTPADLARGSAAAHPHLSEGAPRVTAPKEARVPARAERSPAAEAATPPVTRAAPGESVSAPRSDEATAAALADDTASANPPRVGAATGIDPDATLAPRAVAATGQLDVSSVPWAQVYVDGRLRARSTPVTLRLPAGSHSIRLVNRDAGLERRETVMVRAGKTTQLARRLR